MTREELIAQTKRLIAKINDDNAYGMYAEVRELLRTYGGPQNAFLTSLDKQDPFKRYDPAADIRSILESFLDYLEAGLHADISPERQAQLDVVSDFLEMAQALLETTGVHPAAPAMIIGATLEEYLRTWVESQNLPLGNRKPGIESYSQVLREAESITKQDSKDITAWAGIRNHAAHGEWEEVADKDRIMLMLLEGVNLFMRKYSKS